ncbi:MAG: hypothetical protein GX973_02600, partial [Firmicutes bacterium]|nr:hypothetical protein [Bacillota bacterium]
MLKSLALSTRVSFTMACNHFIYYLQKLPWLGGKIPNSIYNNRDIKLGLAILVELAKQLFGFLGPFLSLGLLIAAPMFAMGFNIENRALLYHYFFFIYFLIGPFASTVIFQTRDMNAYVLLNLLKLPAKDYLLSKVIYNLGIRTARYLVVFTFIGLFIDITFGEILLFSGYILFAALIWEYLILKIFLLFKINLYDKLVPSLAFIVLVAAACYLLPIRGIILPLQGALSNVLTYLSFALLATVSFWQLYSFDGYPAVIKITISRDKLLGLEDLFRNLQFADVNLTEEKLVREKVTNTGNLQGYALFNHLFFARHRRIITKPMQSKIALVSGLALAIWGILFFKPDLRPLVYDNILSISPSLIFVMYLLSSGEKFSR